MTTPGLAWAILVIAGVFEIAWAVGLKYTEGFTRPLATTLTVVAMIISTVLLARSARVLPIGTAYAVWTGIGAAGTAILGVILFDEAATIARFACIGLILVGIAGLKLLT